MQLITYDRKQTAKIFWAVAGIFAAVIAYTGRATDPAVLATAVLLAIVSIYPFYLWMLGSSHGLPAWPVFAFMNGGMAVLPMVQDLPQLRPFSSGEIVFGGITMIIFVVLGTMVWLSASMKAPRPPKKVLMIAREHSERYLLLFLLVGALYQANSLGGFVSFPGNIQPVVRSLSTALASMSIFVLSFYFGRGLLGKQTAMIYLGLTVFLLLCNAASLMLAPVIVPAALTMMGYTLGANRLPWKMLAVLFVAISVLHAGKWEMRGKHWGEGSEALLGVGGTKLTPLDLPGYFTEWVGYGLTELGGWSGALRVASEEENTSQSVFERAGVMHLLLLVQQKSPDEVPFLNGATYAHIPRLFIPRFLDPNKGITHTGNIMLSVNYGVLSIEGAQLTSVGWGLVAEAYANFGMLGVGLLAIVLGAFYAFVSNRTAGVPLTSLAFVNGLSVMAAATSADTLAIFVTVQFQGILGVSVASLFIMKRLANPFAENEPMENGAKATADPRLRAGSLRPHDGGSAAGLPANPAEGAPEARAGGPRDVGTGGTVRNLPQRTPKRIARWMPRRVRAAVAAQYAAEENGKLKAESGEEEKEAGDRGQVAGVGQHTANGIRQEEKQRPRQVAVPYRNYRRYRG